MLDTLSARVAALRLELIRLDGMALDPLAGDNHVNVATCHLQTAIDVLDEAQALQAAATVTVDNLVQRAVD